MSAPPIARIVADVYEIVEMAEHSERCGRRVMNEDRIHWCVSCLYRWDYDAAYSPSGLGSDAVGRSHVSQSNPTGDTAISKASLVRACHEAANEIEEARRRLLRAVNRLDAALERADPPHQRPAVRYPPGRDATTSSLEEARSAQLRRRSSDKGWGTG